MNRMVRAVWAELAADARVLWPRRVARIGDAERRLRLFAYGTGCLVLAVAFLGWARDTRTSLFLLGFSAGWVLLWLPRRMRRLGFRSTVDVRCTPQDAYAFISNPNNWHLYVPGLELREPVEAPVHIGTVIPLRMSRVREIPLEGEEEVIAYEPAWRFATRSRDDPGGGTGTYTFQPVTILTRIEYAYRADVPLTIALIGEAGVGRWLLIRNMRKNRDRAMNRIKDLLEGRGAATV